jgi:hypothetical protein
VWLTTVAFSGNGGVSADGYGANAVNKRASGGGRVASVYSNSTFTGSVSVRGGRQDALNWDGHGQPGTLWEPRRTFPTTGVFAPDSEFSYHFPDAGTAHHWDLRISNLWFEVHGGDVTVTNLVIHDGFLRWDRYAQKAGGVSDMTNMSLSGDVRVLSVSKVSDLSLVPGDYSLGTVVVGTNAHLSCYGDPTAINTDSGGTAGAPHGEGVTLACNMLAVTGAVYLTELGFGTSSGPGKSTSSAGYGGRGQSGGASYGSLAQPTALGSGGGYGPGGGAVKLVVAGTFDLRGEIAANGASGNTGGGSGGSIWVIANALSGAGLVHADGGDNNTPAYAGGGGRVRVDVAQGSFAGIVRAGGGLNPNTGTHAETGTVVRLSAPTFGASALPSAGAVLTTALSVNRHPTGIVLTRDVSRWSSILEWTDTSTDGQLIQLDNAATYTLTGLSPNADLRIYDNGADLLGHATNSGPAGTISFSVTLDAPHLIRVGQPGGTILFIR